VCPPRHIRKVRDCDPIFETLKNTAGVMSSAAASVASASAAATVSGYRRRSSRRAALTASAVSAAAGPLASRAASTSMHRLAGVGNPATAAAKRICRRQHQQYARSGGRGAAVVASSEGTAARDGTYHRRCDAMQSSPARTFLHRSFCAFPTVFVRSLSHQRLFLDYW